MTEAYCILEAAASQPQRGHPRHCGAHCPRLALQRLTAGEDESILAPSAI